MFKLNMASWDRIVRAVVAVVFFILVATGVTTGWLSIVLGVLGAIFLLTSIFGFCPLYAVFKFGTLKS